MTNIILPLKRTRNWSLPGLDILTMTETTHPWPDYIHQSFDSAIHSDPSGTDQSVFYGPYTRLLYTLFSLRGQFEVVPKLKNRMMDQDFVPVLLVEVDRHPVFFMAIKPPAAFHDSGEPDEHMRRLFGDLRQNLDIPTLHGISAYGTRLSFYEYDSATQSVQPSIGRWDCDVLQPEGADS